MDKQGKQKTIKVENYTRLLGSNVSNNLSWKDHLFTGEKALIPKIRQQLGALRTLAKVLPRKSRLLLTNGLIMSKVSYLIQLWGGACKSDIRKVQIIVNQAARFVTNCNKRTRTIKLMHRCGWLTVSELDSLSIIGFHVASGIQEHPSIYS